MESFFYLVLLLMTVMTLCCCFSWIAERGMTSGPRVKCDGVKGEMNIMWTHRRPKRRRSTAGMRGRRKFGKESKSFCSGGRSLNCGSPARNRVTWRGATHISSGAKSVGWVGKLKRWAIVWSVK